MVQIVQEVKLCYCKCPGISHKAQEKLQVFRQSQKNKVFESVVNYKPQLKLLNATCIGAPKTPKT